MCGWVGMGMRGWHGNVDVMVWECGRVRMIIWTGSHGKLLEFLVKIGRGTREVGTLMSILPGTQPLPLYYLVLQSYSNPPLPGTPTPLSQVLQSPYVFLTHTLSLTIALITFPYPYFYPNRHPYPHPNP